jgi:spore coat protein CotH
VSPQASPGVPPVFQVPEPIAVRVSVHSSGRTWTNVRMRYKGNSSLMAATSTGNGKVPFRLDFAPDRKASSSQSFYGFRKLTFSSNFADDSQLREVLATEVLRDRGVPAARAAFYRVVVDTGEGARYWGLYTMVEDPSDGAMLDAQLGGRGANLYKPDGPAATWTRFEPASFEKKTNEGGRDFSDVIAAIDALHSDTTDRRAWRGRIERVFDVDLFLRWLAVNTAILNWDAYGAMAHNYYLYGDAVRGGRLRWIPWDHNMAFGAGPGGLRHDAVEGVDQEVGMIVAGNHQGNVERPAIALRRPGRSDASLPAVRLPGCQVIPTHGSCRTAHIQQSYCTYPAVGADISMRRRASSRPPQDTLRTQAMPQISGTPPRRTRSAHSPGSCGPSQEEA